MKKHIVMFCILASTLATPRVHAGWFKNLAAVSIGYWGYKKTTSWQSGVVHGAIVWGLCGLLRKPLRSWWFNCARMFESSYEKIRLSMKNPFASEAEILEAIEQDFPKDNAVKLVDIRNIMNKIADGKMHFSRSLLEKIISTYAGDLCKGVGGDSMKNTIKEVIKNNKLFGIENPQKAEEKVEELTRTK